jgi:hypothetical protein
VGDRVAHAGVADELDLGGEEADLAGAELGDVLHGGLEDAEAVDLVGAAGLHHADAVALADDAVDDADEDDDAEVGVVVAVDQHGLEGRVAVALGRGQAGDDGLEHVGDAEAGLGRDEDGVGGVEADHVLDLLLHAVGLGGGEVDLVEDGDDLVVGVDGLVDVGERLGLDALGGVDDEERAFDRAHGAGDLVAEVDVAGGVDEVEDVGLAVLRGVVDADGVGLDGDAALALDVHRVEELLLHVAFGHGAGELDQPVGKGRLAVVDMGHDGEIADLGELGHGAGYGGVSGGCRGGRLLALDGAHEVADHRHAHVVARLDRDDGAPGLGEIDVPVDAPVGALLRQVAGLGGDEGRAPISRTRNVFLFSGPAGRGRGRPRYPAGRRGW